MRNATRENCWLLLRINIVHIVQLRHFPVAAAVAVSIAEASGCINFILQNFKNASTLHGKTLYRRRPLSQTVYLY
jgi:hypothetical protein